MTAELWNEQRSIINSAISGIKKDLATTNRSLRWTSGYPRSQPVFPFRAYASIALDGRDDDIDSIDFSVDCKWEGERLRISSDICYSDGQFIAEGPVVQEPEGVDRAVWVRQQIQDAMEFFRSNLEEVRKLVRPAD